LPLESKKPSKNFRNALSIQKIKNVKSVFYYVCQVALSKTPDTGSASLCGTQYSAIYTCIAQYYYHLCIPKKIPKYRTVRKHRTPVLFYIYDLGSCSPS